MALSYRQVRIIRQVFGITFLAFVAYWMFVFVGVGLMFRVGW